MTNNPLKKIIEGQIKIDREVNESLAALWHMISAIAQVLTSEQQKKLMGSSQFRDRFTLSADIADIDKEIKKEAEANRFIIDK